MLGIDIALLVGGGIVLVAVAAWVGDRVGPRAEARQRRLQGQRNAELEKRRLEEQCAVCGAAVDPTQDLWEAGQWWHRSCYREAVH